MKTIREAANALCDRWDTPLWKDAEHTAVFVHELRMALANHCEDKLNMDHIGEAAKLVQPEQIKYRRGDWLRCLETDDVCVVHMSGSANQWVKFPDGDVLSFTNAQVAELFDKIPKERDWEGIAADQAMTIALMKSEQEPVAWLKVVSNWWGAPVFAIAKPNEANAKPVYTAPPSREWVGLTDGKIDAVTNVQWGGMSGQPLAAHRAYARAIEAKLKEQNYD